MPPHLRLAVLALRVTLALAPMVACSKSDAKPDAAPDGATSTASLVLTAAQIQHGKVRWSPAVAGAAMTGTTVPGELTPNEDRTARLGAPGSGRIVAVRVQPGERVSRGQVLVVLQSAEAGMAQADAAKASSEVTSRRAQAQYAASARGRAERLLALKAIPRQDYERALADDEQARAALAQAVSELARARTSARQLGAADVSSSGETVIRASLAGVVLDRTAQPGAVVEAGAPLAVISDVTSLWLQVRAPEQMAGAFHRGGSLSFRVPAYPGERFTGRVETVSAALDPMTRTLAVRATIANANGRLRPAMLATVEVPQATTAVSVMLPDEAVQMMDGTPTVFLVRPDGKGGARFERRVVEIGSRGDGRVSIIRGLAIGEVVVTEGAFAVRSQFEKGSMPEMDM